MIITEEEERGRKGGRGEGGRGEGGREGEEKRERERESNLIYKCFMSSVPINNSW